MPELNFFMNAPTSIDITNISTNKGTGITHVKDVLNFKGETYAFGDGRNDIEMLETVKIGVAMGNAVDEAKAVANYETDRIENDGIVKALKHFELI